ncbi:MbcA/ParS/Xre antitoxin family protein, partial [Pseudomonas syringae pv. tagetis]|uniref:antitoxin Xre/MbcA/ParS toxin-binding domain-containing protein n=1 Tax=Pseudomonas syringae group genomosp. 7 TaxID=251699 RepID=UPI0037700F60
PVASERLDSVAMVASHALRAFVTPELAAQWLITPNAALGNHIPLQLCETGRGPAQLNRLHGGFQERHDQCQSNPF